MNLNTWGIIDWWRIRRERIMLAFVWSLPKSIVYWCGIRLFANATTGSLAGSGPNEVTIDDVFRNWNNGVGGDPAFKESEAYKTSGFTERLKDRKD